MESKEIVYIDGGHHGNEYLERACMVISTILHRGLVRGNQEVLMCSKALNFTSDHAQSRW